MSRGRAYTEDQRAEAIGLALSIGPVRAGRQLGIPPRTVSVWMQSPRAEPIVIQSRDRVAERLWEAVQVGVDQVLAGLRDPKARLSDKARALEVVAQQHALLVGGPTARIETADPLAMAVEGLSAADLDRLTEWLESLEHADAADVPELVEQIRTAQLTAGQEEASDG